MTLARTGLLRLLALTLPLALARAEEVPEPALRSPQPELRSPQPELRSPQPELRSPQPELRSPQPALLLALDGRTAAFALPESGDHWHAPLLLVTPDGKLVVEVLGGRDRERTVLIREVAPDLTLRLGERYLLQPGGITQPSGAAQPAPAVSGGSAAAGVIAALDGERVLVAGVRPAPGTPAELLRDGVVAGELAWLNDATVGRLHPARWRADTPPRLGDAVRYVAAPPADETAAPVPAEPAPRGPEPAGAERIVPGDDPLYDVLATLARRGLIPDATHRQFAGDSEAIYTRREIARFLAPAFGRLLDDTARWPVQESTPIEAAYLLWLLDEFAPELNRLGVAVAAAQARLEPVARDGFSPLLSGLAQARLGVGDDPVDGRVEASAFAVDERLRTGLTLSSEGGEAFPDSRDRSGLAAAFAEYAATHQLTFHAGRRVTRFGYGLHDFLWSDRAKPLDGVGLEWRTKLFGRPFELTQRTGLFDDGRAKYITVRRYQWEPADQLSLAASFGLITDRAGQALVSMFIPLYAARFAAGEGRAGGQGNYLGEFDLSYRFHRDWTVYGQFGVDDFDFSPGGGPRTAQRVGYLAGLHYTPQRALPGTSYRLEGAILPDLGTYVGQQNAGLAWLRDGVLLGHEYGQDAAGVLFRARHRFTPKLDAALHLEAFRQLRSRAVVPQTRRLELTINYDLERYLGIGVGLSHRRRDNLGGVQGNDRQDNLVFLEAYAGY